MWSQLKDLSEVVKARMVAAEPESVRSRRTRVVQALENARKEVNARVERPLSLYRKEHYRDAFLLLLENVTLSKDQIDRNHEMVNLCKLWDRQIPESNANPYKEIELLADVSREGCTRRVVLVTNSEGSVKRPLVSKELNLGEAKSFQLKDLYNEVHLLKQLQDSPFFVEYHEFLHLEYIKSSWLIIEFINIGDMDAVCQSIGSFNLKQTRAVASQVVLGLKHLHDRYVIHADVKPHNLLLSSSGLVKIVDFDISFELLSPPLVVELGRESGTRQYMAPELFPELLDDYMLLYEQEPKGNILNESGKFLSFDYGIDVWAIGISMLDLLYGDNIFSDVDSYIDYERIYKWKKSNCGRDLPGIMEDIFEKYSQNGAIVYPRPEKISNIIRKNSGFAEFLFQKCLVVNTLERATTTELAASSFVSDMVDGLPDSATREQIENTEAAEILRKLIKTAQLG